MSADDLPRARRAVRRRPADPKYPLPLVLAWAAVAAGLGVMLVGLAALLWWTTRDGEPAAVAPRGHAVEMPDGLLGPAVYDPNRPSPDRAPPGGGWQIGQVIVAAQVDVDADDPILFLTVQAATDKPAGSFAGFRRTINTDRPTFLLPDRVIVYPDPDHPLHQLVAWAGLLHRDDTGPGKIFRKLRGDMVPFAKIPGGERMADLDVPGGPVGFPGSIFRLSVRIMRQGQEK